MCTNNAITFGNLPVIQEGLSQYLQTINKIPLLDEAQEHALAIQYREHGDLVAAQKLVLSHLRYVVKVARGFSGYGLAFADLIQEGTIGLMKAVKRFDPKLNVRLVTFAMHWIKAEIHDFIIKNWRIVKVATTKAQRKLFFNLRRAKNQLGWFTREEVNMVAEDLGVKPSEVVEMEQRLYAQDACFEASDVDDEDAYLAPEYRLEAPNTDPALLQANADALQVNSDQLQTALMQLDARSLDIIQSRWLSDKKATFKTLAEKYNVSIERVRQLEQAAMQSLKTEIAY